MAIGFRTSGSVGWKAFVIGAIVVLLLIPLMMLRGLVGERTMSREQAHTKVAEGWGGDLVVGGPMIVLPVERVISRAGNPEIERSHLYLLPGSLDVDVELVLESEPRRVGIYEVPVYLAHARVQGHFDPQALKPLLDRPGVTYRWDQVRLRLPLSDVRSLREVKRARFADLDLKFGPAGAGIYQGVEAAVDPAPITAEASIPFEFQTIIAGSRGFSVLPMGSTTKVGLRSAWPHPSFQGAFLPVERTIGADGFSARWQVLELNRPYRQTFTSGEVSEATLLSSSLGVGLYQPVDAYQRGERAIKYALLFIVLTFLTFFAWEQLGRMRIHPLQYLLVGLALSVFYLLLIALSEHLQFWLAYLIAAAALVMLIGVYISGVLRSHARGIVAATAMTVVYGLLYMLVLSEDYALLLGAIILFLALAGVMIATRRVDWYGDEEGQ